MVDALTLAFAAVVLVGGSLAGAEAIHSTRDAVLRHRATPPGRHRAGRR